MQNFLQNLFSGLLSQIFYQFAIRAAQRRVALIYLRTLQAMRRSLLVAFVVFFSLQLFIFGFVGLAITSIWLLPIAEINDKLYILLGFFAFIFFIPAIGLTVVLSERTWFRASGAEKLLKDL